jgi:ubiquinone biosynthesis monooxygenase Coq7
MRQLNAMDRFFGRVDAGLRASSGVQPLARRENPATNVQDGDLTADEARMVARLVRVDHAGEVAAQALYEGQALTARKPEQAERLRAAAAEEADHLAWCAQRLDELNASPSKLGPIWYAGSFVVGAAAGIAGDRWSLGFVVETERQVEAHLEDHLQRLPAEDRRTRAILAQMKLDESEHGRTAAEAGGGPLPTPIRQAMRAASRVMTVGAYWL